jgi:hypothetical protein
MPESRKKKAPKRILALPDLEHAKSAVLNSLSSATTRRALNPDAPRDPRAGQGRA